MLVPSDEVLALRKATTDDLNDLSNITCAAMPVDPQWDYRFPHREEFPEDYWNGTRLMLKNLMETTGNVINIITVPSKEDGETDRRSIALAAWEPPGSKTGVALASAGCEDGCDADPERMRTVTEMISFARKIWFDELCGSEHLHLKILATHQDYQRRGAATQHCQWGMKLAKEQEVPITLFCSPEGRKLANTHPHNQQHFRENALQSHWVLATIFVPVEGEEEKLFIGAMKYQETCVVRQGDALISLKNDPRETPSRG